MIFKIGDSVTFTGEMQNAEGVVHTATEPTTANIGNMHNGKLEVYVPQPESANSSRCLYRGWISEEQVV